LPRQPVTSCGSGSCSCKTSGAGETDTLETQVEHGALNLASIATRV
jgi:hypothetical protein